MTSTQPVVPRLSASLILVDEQNRLLMVERSPTLKSFAKAYVFPGGNCEPEDASEKMTAIRETFEETGILLVSPPTSMSKDALNAARKRIHSQNLSFTTFLADNGLTADTGSLLPFTQWTTPPTIKRRFHTHFFIAFLPSATYTTQVPTTDGGAEVASTRFLTPQDAISEVRAQKMTLMPPQFYILTTLSSILTGEKNTPAERDIIAQLAHGPFGSWKINPRVLSRKEEQNTLTLTYEGDEMRGGHPGARHRVHVLSTPAGMQVLNLERNIDIFSTVLVDYKL